MSRYIRRFRALAITLALVVASNVAISTLEASQKSIVPTKPTMPKPIRLASNDAIEIISKSIVPTKPTMPRPTSLAVNDADHQVSKSIVPTKPTMPRP